MAGRQQSSVDASSQTDEVLNNQPDASWWTWSWRVLTRQHPPPLVLARIDETYEFQNTRECILELLRRYGSLVSFFGEQLKILVTDPFRWSRQIETAFTEQVNGLWKVRHETVGVIMLSLLAQLAMWMVVQLIHIELWMPKAKRLLLRMPFTKLMWTLWDRFVNSKLIRVQELQAELELLKLQFGKDALAHSRRIDQISAPTLSVAAELGDVPFETSILIDTGSTVNVIPWKKAKRQSWVIDIDSEEVMGKRLIGFNGCSSEVKGITVQKIKIGQWTTEIPFVVVKGTSKTILGMPALLKMKLRVDVPNSSLLDESGNVLPCNDQAEASQNCHLVKDKGGPSKQGSSQKNC